MKKITFLSFIALLAIAPNLANAGSSQGLIKGVLAGDAPQVFFSAGVHQNKPACSTQGDDWAISTATQGGKTTQAVLLTAYALKKPIHVEGKGVCDVWGDRETVNYLYTVD
ncbi:MAG: hypothetical protein NTX45_13395 [Proteobacteria bacterium]|nr:hypothetical protein [Pseudomonadota bacterium]